MRESLLVAASAALAIHSAGCASDAPLSEDELPKEEAGAVGAADAWGFSDSPEQFGIPLERRIDELPRVGRAAVMPWSDTYWPMTDDSYNVRWRGPGTLSPLELYDMAFNGWVPTPKHLAARPLTSESCRTGEWDRAYYDTLGPAARAWSESHGVGRARNGRDDDGDGRIDECDDLDGMEYWWGSCHAWVPASMLEPEPLEPVVINGVRFELSDIRALLTLLYEEAQQIAVGDRCALDHPERDATGRIVDGACRGVNAGTFHLVATNLLGLRHQAFGEDRFATREVWNQPVAGYRITMQEERTEAQAVALLSRGTERYTLNTAARRWMEVRADVDYIIESHPSTQASTPIIDRLVRTDHYHYVLELDAEGRVIGGEWIRDAGASEDHDRPDYLWIALGPGRMVNPHVRMSDVRALLRQSRPDLRAERVVTARQVVDTVVRDWPYAGVTSRIDVAEELVATRAIVNVQVLHSWMYDVQVVLRRNGRQIVLFDRNPRGSVTALTASFPVDALVGESVRGTWELEVVDRDGRNTGRFVEWGLELHGLGAGPEPEPMPEPEPTPEPERIDRTYSSSGAAVAIPDALATGIASVIAVPDAVTAELVEVSVDITHPYRGDLRVIVEHGGVQHVLHDRQGGSADDLHLRLEIPTFRGARTQGDWTLRVIDAASRDVGTLSGWSVRVAGR